MLADGYLWGTPKGKLDHNVSRQCFTRRLTVGSPIGIAQGMPILGNGHKKNQRECRYGVYGINPGGHILVVASDLAFVNRYLI